VEKFDHRLGDVADRVLLGDALEVLRTLPNGLVHTCVTSPPYWGLRDYGVEGQLGLEATPEEYVERLVEVFREVWRVLRDDGTLWLVLGDSYNAAGRKGHGTRVGYKQGTNRASAAGTDKHRPSADSLKEKDLIGIPWRVAFALQADGWWLRAENIWSKPNPMPESVTDRTTRSHETVFHLSKSATYYYDADAVRESNAFNPNWNYGSERYRRNARLEGRESHKIQYKKGKSGWHGFAPAGPNGNGRNLRSVWTIPTQPCPDAHFAVFPPALVRPCVLAGCPARCCPRCGKPWVRLVEDVGRVRIREGSDTSGGSAQDAATGRHGKNSIFKTGEKRITITTGFRPTCACGTEHPIPQEELEADPTLIDDFEIKSFDPVPGVVLDPFFGRGTTGRVALEYGRHFVGIELNPDYVAMAEKYLAPFRQQAVML